MLILRGVKENNLKNIDLDLPLGKSIVITGPSGSGKSSLAFNTIYAEGQRRYMQSLSTYARQFMEKFRPPLVKSISNIPPTVALEQINPVKNARAIVATTTELDDYIRVLFEKIGVEYCPTCNVAMEKLSYDEIFDKLLEKFKEKIVLLTFNRKLPSSTLLCKEVLNSFLRSGYSRFIFKNQILSLDESINYENFVDKEVYFIIDRIKSLNEEERRRVIEALENGIRLGNGYVSIFVSNNGEKIRRKDDVTTFHKCPNCGKTAQLRNAASLSFNNPIGACKTCKGFGNIIDIDPERVVPNPNLSILNGAIEPFTKPSLMKWQRKLLEFCEWERIDYKLPFKDLEEKDKKKILFGCKNFRGVRDVLKRLEKDIYKVGVRVFLNRYRAVFTCKDCDGKRLSKQGLLVRICNRTIADLFELSIEECLYFFKSLHLLKREMSICADILEQIIKRLTYLDRVGLGYLTLSRPTKTLSAGEFQRILIATQLSLGLSDTLYVLDEPSIGLHPTNTQKLLELLEDIKNKPNTLVIVEHDPEIIKWADYIVDLGPGSGRFGGEVIYAGSLQNFMYSKSQTAESIRNWREYCKLQINKTNEIRPINFLRIEGACENNLKNIDVEIPLNSFVVVTGVSGSGKSTLVVDTMYRALSRIYYGTAEKVGKFDKIFGFDKISGVELVDQTPIGRSSRSNPITFIKGYDEIRALFARTREAMAMGLSPGHFSFNVPGGRCETCQGEGKIKVEMIFMEDIWISCHECNEKRFKPFILSIKYKNKNIDECLRMTVDEAFSFFSDVPSLRTKLGVLREVGLGYLELGQPSYSLSGGEAQRIKIAKTLIEGSQKENPTLFLFDEPTTGLHFKEVEKLILAFSKLLSRGHSVVVIEHNLQMILAANYVVDLGPDGGDYGGRVVAVGSPAEIAEKKLPRTGLYLSEILE